MRWRSFSFPLPRFPWLWLLPQGCQDTSKVQGSWPFSPLVSSFPFPRDQVSIEQRTPMFPGQSMFASEHRSAWRSLRTPRRFHNCSEGCWHTDFLLRWDLFYRPEHSTGWFCLLHWHPWWHWPCQPWRCRWHFWGWVCQCTFFCRGGEFRRIRRGFALSRIFFKRQCRSLMHQYQLQNPWRWRYFRPNWISSLMEGLNERLETFL